MADSMAVFRIWLSHTAPPKFACSTSWLSTWVPDATMTANVTEGCQGSGRVISHSQAMFLYIGLLYYSGVYRDVLLCVL